MARSDPWAGPLDHYHALTAVRRAATARAWVQLADQLDAGALRLVEASLAGAPGEPLLELRWVDEWPGHGRPVARVWGYDRPGDDWTAEVHWRDT